MAGILIIISVALLAALTIGSAASFNVGMLHQSENARTASLLAESAIQQAVAELMRDPLWGRNPATDRIAYAGSVEGSEVSLTFDSGAGRPYSTNNASSGPVDGWSRSRLLSGARVPSERVHLVAVARCRNVQRTREAVVHVPSFTVSLASTGRVNLSNSLVGSLKSPADLAGLSSDPELLGPGDLATNSDDSRSVTLSNGSRVSGNVQSRGEVTVESGSSVGGEVRRGYSAADIPIIDLNEYDPARPDPAHPDRGSPLIVRPLSPGMHGHETIVGMTRCSGSTTINGDLTMDNGILYVDGNLRVEGGIRGRGAVVVTGQTRVRGGATLASDDNVALLSRGDILLEGNAGNDYLFQGLVYTQGNFTARFFTVVGSFIAASTVPGNGNVDLHGSRIFHSPVANQVEVYLPFQQSLQFASIINDPAVHNIPLDGENVFSYGLSPVSHAGITPPPVSPDHYNTPARGASFGNPAGGWDWWNPMALEIRRQGSQYVYEVQFNQEGNPTTLVFPSRTELINFIDSHHASRCAAYHDGLDWQGDPYPVEGPLVVQGTHGPDPGFLQMWDAGLNDYRNLRVGDPNPLVGLRKETSPYLRRAWNLKLEEWERKNRIVARSAEVANFSLDPNRFLKLRDKVRLAATLEYSD